MSFENLTALEYIAVADEVIYSAMLRWVFGPDSPLALRARLGILQELAGDEFENCTRIETTTEWKNIDLVVDLIAPDRTWRIAIENKVKAEEGEDQLVRYDERLGDASKIFLTLTGEAPRSAAVGWRTFSYARLRALLAPLAETANNTYLTDYVAMIGRLVHAADLVLSEPRSHAAFVFGSENAPGGTATASPAFGRYVRTLRLDKVLQRIWLGEAARRALARLPALDPHWRLRVENEKQSLMNLETHAFSAGVIGLQLQYGKFKFFTRPDDYPKRSPTPEVRSRLQSILQQMRPHLPPCGEMTGTHTGKGFRSYVSAQTLADHDLDIAAELIGAHVQRLVTAVDALVVTNALSPRT